MTSGCSSLPYPLVSSARANPPTATASRWVAVLCALAVWVVGLLAANPHLHEEVHADADHPEHSCAVTLFSHGIDRDTGSACIAWAPLGSASSDLPGQPASPVDEKSHRLPPGRGPPVC